MPGWQVPALAEDEAALETSIHAMCSRRIVLLGEAAHGNGHSDAFKAALVERLIERCGFRAVLFESSFYEFVPIWRTQRAKQPVTSTMIATAVGGLWKFNREFQPLLPFLASKADKGLFVGGIDFQLGGFEQDYTNAGMISELTQYLDPTTREICLSVTQARISKDLNSEQKAQAATCTAAIARGLAGKRNDVAREQAAMLQNLTAYLGSGFANGPGSFIAARDHQMFENLKLVRAMLPNRTKVIVWTANAHAAKGADEAKDFSGIRNFGSYVFGAFGKNSYALATTALAGTQRWGRQVKSLPEAPVGSLERLAIAADTATSVFLDFNTLKAHGSVFGGAFGYQYAKADWWQRFDGMVVFAEEHAAYSSRYGN